MINIHRRIEPEKRPSRMLLQIHDELLFEVPESDVEEERDVVAKEMTEALSLRVSVEVHTKVGRNWLEVT
jgi:DNA polymerase-1